jgi:hypothetical protein
MKQYDSAVPSIFLFFFTKAIITSSSECMPETNRKSQPFFHCLPHHYLLMQMILFLQTLFLQKYLKSVPAGVQREITHILRNNKSRSSTEN